MYQIDKNIPVPSWRGEKKNHAEFLRQLEVGDSFFIKERGLNTQRAHGRWWKIAKNLGVKLVFRTQPGGVRCWRGK